MIMEFGKNVINKRFIDSVNRLIESNLTLNKTILAESLGIGKSKFSEILNSRMNVPVDMIADYCYKYKIDANWMLTGEYSGKTSEMFQLSNGEGMVEENHDKGYCDVPLYDITAGLGFLSEGSKMNAIDTIKIPHITKSDGAVFIIGDSMYPLLKSGDIAIYKRIHNLNYLNYGDVHIVSYQIDGDDYVVVKYVHKSEKPDHIRLVSYNEHYDPVDIPLSSINVIAIVQANIRYNTM